MRKYRLHIRPLAEADLDGHAAHIAQDNLEAGLMLYDRAAETYEMLRHMPQIGVIYHTTRPELMGLRYVPIKVFSRYLVFYKVTDETVDIIRVLHARMDKDGWL
ncbi:type II toxin-antitoxin system RelE/ParE family toxin [Paremcibacter congregatus]|uniref:type II toxin-antitoxin system RelE/ParE family toxin n=1 Tax=Paremcibacter congregatus TaxID=2043170 RepID=UPI0030EF8DF1|tara:strand:+ start:3368 stop:3679 length:312 start_codon:yes stop_codon:yes gene_type:complete